MRRCVAMALLMVQGVALSGAGVADDTVQVVYATVKASKVQERLKLFGGDDARRELTLKGLFAAVGCKGAALTEQAVPGSKLPNVVCVLPGATNEEIVVGGHFDHADLGEGVADNWSGASMLPSLYQALQGETRHHTYVFVGFAAEEKGLIGSDFYAKSMTPEEKKGTEVMVNLDTLGLGPTKVWTSQSDPVLLGVLGALAKRMTLPLEGINLNGFGRSDEESFIAQGVCAIAVHSLTRGNTHVLHHQADNPLAIQFGDYYDTYRLMAAYLAVLDMQALPSPHLCTAKPVEPGYRGGFNRRGGPILGTRR